MQQQQSKAHRPANLIVTALVYIIYVGLLLLFGFQTWQFVNFLFPNDQLTMKVLTLISFDAMALLWGVADLYYAFMSKGAKTWVRVAWVVTFILSLVASILYLVIQAFFRFHVGISEAMVDWGYTISLFALTFNIITLMMFIYLEYSARHPHQDEFVGPWITPRESVPATLAQTGTIVNPAPAPAPADIEQVKLLEALRTLGITDTNTLQTAVLQLGTTGSIPAVNGNGAQPKNSKRLGN